MADIQITGNVGSIDLKYTGSGKAVASISVAENHRRKNGQEWVDDGTTWWRVTAWERQAETLAEHIQKGTRVLVTGTVKSREYEKDGQTRTSYDVTARHVAVIPKQQQGSSAPAGGQAGDQWASTGPVAGGQSADAWGAQSFGDQPPY